MVVRPEAPSSAGTPAQLALFEVFDPKGTNMVAIYDLAPRFVFDTRDGEPRKLIERDFSFNGKRYKITLKPTRLQVDSGEVVDRYLGEREQIVEEVIRRLASNHNRVMLHGENKVRFPFTIYEVMEELRRVKHTYNRDEIRESVMLLNEVRMKIESLDDRRQPLLSASAFPVMAMRKGEEDDTDTFVEFNPLVADAIRMLSFQQVSYELLMQIRDPVARWLMKRLHVQIGATGEPVHQMTAREIRHNSGMSEWKTTRNLLRRVVRAVELLKQKGILHDVESSEQKMGKRKCDVLFTLVGADDFVAQATSSKKFAEDNLAEFRRVTNGRDPGREFVPLPSGEVYRLRDRLKRRALTGPAPERSRIVGPPSRLQTMG
jgi:hypothetical protein